jgi:hypothetical protein
MPSSFFRCLCQNWFFEAWLRCIKYLRRDRVKNRKSIGSARRAETTVLENADQNILCCFSGLNHHAKVQESPVACGSNPLPYAVAGLTDKFVRSNHVE